VFYDPASQIALLLKEIDIVPSALQYALAAFSVIYTTKKPKQVYSFHAGLGKSLIMSLAGLYAIQQCQVPTVHFVFPNTHLMERDKQEF
jgi:hypothetical protein